jgi:hypothetical protein
VTKTKVLRALDLVRAGDVDAALSELSGVDTTRDRTPKRVSDRWFSFERAPAGAHTVPLISMRENTPEALRVAADQIEPALMARQPVELPIHVVNADPAVCEGLRFLEAYALGG